jgi:peptide-methionine (S)-S-oxide reductase
MAPQTQTAVFGGGCFWCTEAVFERLQGVVSVLPGYAGGVLKNPTYKQVCSGNTGHAEVVKIAYNPAQISYRDLLEVFFATHDPTTPDRQGHDVGTQYRSIILYSTEDEKAQAETFIRELSESGCKAVTEIKPLESFYEAEPYHRQYYRNNSTQPYCQFVIHPKLGKFQEKFHQLLSKSETKN